MFAFTVFSLLPAFFPSAGVLLASRFFQGLSLGAFGVLIRAIFSDILPTERLLHTMPMVATMWGIGPVIGPFIGGYLLFYLGWQACFYFFALFGFIAFCALGLLLPETNQKKQSFKLERFRSNLTEVITNRLFIGIILSMAFSYTLLIVFNTLGPFLVQDKMGYSPVDFGHLALLCGAVFLSATLSTRYFIKRYDPLLIYKYAVPVALVAGVVFFVFGFIFKESLVVLMLATFAMFFATGTIYPTGMAKGVALFRHISGSASAVMNLVNFVITALFAASMGWIDAKNVFVLTSVYLVFVLFCGMAYLIFIYPKAKQQGV